MAGQVAEFTDENFESEVIQSEGTVVVDFWAPWCGPCRAIAPMIDELANENSNAKIGKLNIDDARSIAQNYGIQNIPTILVFKNGQISEQFMGGSIQKAKLQEAIDA